jgi:hypothetical protein
LLWWEPPRASLYTARQCLYNESQAFAREEAGLDKEELKEKLLDFWDSLKETAGKVWEEVVDRVLDLWDSFKKLPKPVQIGIAAGLAVVILIAVLVPTLYTPKLPVIAVQNTADLTGEGNWISVKNLSNKPLRKFYLILDERYIYYIDNLDPQSQERILNKDFFTRLQGNRLGPKVGSNITGTKIVAFSKQGKTEIWLVEKPRGLFGN